MTERVISLGDIRQVAVIGGGLMGHGIAQVFAQNNYLVTMYDLDISILDKALSQIKSNLETFVELDLERKERIGEILFRIRTTADLQESLKGAQYVVEAAPEDLELKTALFEQLDRLCPEETILASNTSTLPSWEIGRRVKKKDRLIVTHWFNPPHIIPAVEVVKGERTSEEVFRLSCELMKKIGKRPIKVLKEVPGFLINRIQTAMLREILSLLEQGVAEAEDIDAGVTNSFGLRLPIFGPLRTIDMAGLHPWYKGIQNLFPSLDRSTEVPKIFKEKVERGELGLKTGKGFFQYEREEAPALSNISKERDKKLLTLLKLLSN